MHPKSSHQSSGCLGFKDLDTEEIGILEPSSNNFIAHYCVTTPIPSAEVEHDLFKRTGRWPGNRHIAAGQHCGAYLIDGAPQFSRIIVVGVCMQADSIEPSVAINKELDLRFVLGYSPLEFRDTLMAMAEGRIRCEQLITGQVRLDGVDAAFAALGDPNRHAKILIDPSSQASAPDSPAPR